MIDGENGPEAARLSASGKLWKDALIMRDDVSHSLWSQLEGWAVAGTEEGTPLAVYPHFERATYEAWKTRHPQTLVLRKRQGEGRRTRSVYARYFADGDALGVLGSANPDDRLPGKALVIGVVGETERVALAFDALEKSGTREFSIDDAAAVCRIDTLSGSVRCEIRKGEEGLQPLHATLVYWFAWAQAYPDTRLID